MSDYPDTPITREEQYLAAGLDGGDLPDPITREEKYLHEIATKMQGGGSSVTVEPLTVAQNGTTTAPSGKAYSPVTTNVPNSYGASDEGKVVSNGALVAQTAHAPVTQNGTIDTTLYNSVPVNVDGNPNYVETISGTLSNPWGENTPLDLFTAARNGNLTMYIEASVAYSEGGAEETATMMFLPISGLPTFGFTKPSTSTSVLNFARVGYSNTGKLSRAVAGNINTSAESQELITLSGDTPCTLTIIHHPLPDSE